MEYVSFIFDLIAFVFQMGLEAISYIKQKIRGWLKPLSFRDWIATIWTLGGAIVSLWIYRFKTYGQAPILVISNYIVYLELGKEGITRVEFEVWNRRRHPVVAREITARFRNFTPEPDDQDDWIKMSGENALISNKSYLIEPRNRHLFKMEVSPALETRKNTLPNMLEVKVPIFDPINNKTSVLAAALN
jgi:hypothetical protein